VLRGRAGVRVLAFGLVLLGCAVFAWGLRYKLSLYESPRATYRHMPEAKLLTGKERTVSPVLDIRRAVHAAEPLALTGLALVFFVLMGAKLFPGFSGWAPRMTPVWITPVRGVAAAHFVRPPPRLR